MLYETLGQVRDAYEHDKYKPKTPYPMGNKLNADVIIDEHQTVAWNREEVKRLNASVDVEKNKYEVEKSTLNKQLYADATRALQAEYGFTHLETAQKIWQVVYDKKHAFMGEVWDYADELADFVRYCMDVEYD